MTRWVAWVFAMVVTAGMPARAQEPARVAAGRAVYEREKCAACHQITGRGNSRFPLDHVGSRLTADQIRRWMTHTAEMESKLPKLPAIRMSARKYRLNPADLDSLVEYLASLK